MRAKARDPMVEEPRGWIALGAAGCHSLREGMCCEERSSCDSQRAPFAKKVCDRQTHTDTTVHNTHGHSDRDTPQAVRSTARHVCLQECPRPCTAVSQVFSGSCSHKAWHLQTPIARGRVLVVLPTGSYR